MDHDANIDTSHAAVDPLSTVVQAIKGLAYGEVHITIHDSKIVRIERIERLRVNPAQGGSAFAPRQNGGEE